MRPMKKKKKGSSKNMKPSTQGEVYQCGQCGTKETIPEDVLDYFDFTHGERTPLTGPHVFTCEKCGAEMYPVWWLEKQKRVTD